MNRTLTNIDLLVKTWWLLLLRFCKWKFKQSQDVFTVFSLSVLQAVFSPVVFPAASGLVQGRQTRAERRNPKATYRSSSSGCSGGASPGSSPPSPGRRAPDRSYQQQAPRLAPGCPTGTPSPPQPRYCWTLRAAGTLVTPQTHCTPLF